MTVVLELDRPLLLDGGTGRELLKRGVPILTEIWSATALLSCARDRPEVHADFIRAGADIITTNTYGIARERLAREGIEDRYRELNHARGRDRRTGARRCRRAGRRSPAVCRRFQGATGRTGSGSFEACCRSIASRRAPCALCRPLYLRDDVERGRGLFGRLCGGCHWEAGLGRLDAARGPVRPPAQRRDVTEASPLWPSSRLRLPR